MLKYKILDSVFNLIEPLKSNHSQEIEDKAVMTHKEYTKEYKKDFLTIEFSNIEDSNNNFEKLIEAYCELALFPDQEIFQKFECFGIKEDHLKWFIPLNEIEGCLYELKSKHKINYNFYLILLLVKAHLMIQIANELQLMKPELIHYFDSKNHKKTNSTSYQYSRYKNNQKYKRKKPISPDATELIFNEAEVDSNKILKELPDPTNFLKNMINGKSEIFICNIIRIGLEKPDRMKPRAFHHHIYQFIRLITKHPKLLDVKDISDLPHGYDSIPQYRDRMLRSIFLSKKNSIDFGSV